MADYDTSIRVSTKVDSSELDKVAKTFKDIEGNADDAKEKVEELDKAGTSANGDAYKEQTKNLEKYNHELDKRIEKQKEASNTEQGEPNYRSVWTEKEEERIDSILEKIKEKNDLEQKNTDISEISTSDFDWGKNAEDAARINAEINEINSKMDKTDAKTVTVNEHMNQLRVDVEEYAKALKELSDKGYGPRDEDYDRVYLALLNASDAVKEYEANMKKLTAKGMAEEEARITKEKEKQAEQQRKQEEAAERNLQRENARIEREAKAQAAEEARKQKVIQKEEELAAKKREQEAEEQKLQSIRINAEVSNQKLVDLLEEQTRLLARKAELEKAGVTDGYKEYDEINARLAQIKQEVEYQKNGFQKLGDSAKKAFKKVNDGAKKSGGLLKTFSSRLKGITLSLLVFNWITKAFNTMVAGMKEGFNNLVQYSDKYNDAMSQLKSAGTQLKNSFATAFAPIVTMVIPYLVQLISYITVAANKVAEFMAIMSGASSWTKAVAVQEDYAASLNNTAKASKKAAGALASFDTISVLSKSDSGSGAGTTSPKDMFEEVAVDNQKVKAFDALKESAKELMDLFSMGFGDGLGDFDTQIEDIRDNLLSIRDSLIGIFTDGDVVAAAQDAYSKIIVAAGQIAGSFLSIGATIVQNLTGGMAIYLEENADYLKKKIINLFDITGDIAEIVGEACTAFANIFSAFGDENGQQLTANLIGIFVDTFLELSELVGELVRDILDIITRPFIDNQEEFKTALDGFLGTAATVFGTFKDAVDDTFAKIEEVYQQYFKPFFDSVAQGLSDLTAHFLEFWNGNVQPLLDEWAAEFDTLWKESIQPMIDNFIELLGQLAELIMVLWEEYLVPLIDWIIDNVLPVLLPIIDGVMEAFWAVLDGISEVVSGIIDVISGITEFLIGVFTGDWEKAWNGVTEIFEGVKKTIKGIVNGILGMVEALANGVVDAINTVIRAMNNLDFDIPDWVPGIGGNHYGFSIPELSRITIPRLADGAVIRGGNPFAAILGDQPLGQTNVETPVSTIEDAVARGMEKYSGARDITVNLNYDGETFARLSLHDLLAEMEREGYDIDVLGGI